MVREASGCDSTTDFTELGMQRVLGTKCRLFFAGMLLAWCGFGLNVLADEKTYDEAQTTRLLRFWYAGVSALESGAPLQHTAAPLIIELDAATRLTIPPHLAQQEVVEVQRMDLGAGLEDAVVIGLDARTVDVLHQGYALVYARKDKQMVLQAELPLREHFERFQKAWVNTDKPVLVINGFSGNHFMDLWVYRFAGGQPELLFADGSAAGAEFRYDVTTPIPTIWIAAEDWGDPNWNFATSDRRWMVYTWDGKEFVYNEHLSSARDMSPEERLAFYTMAIKQKMKQTKEQVVPRVSERPNRSKLVDTRPN